MRRMFVTVVVLVAALGIAQARWVPLEAGAPERAAEFRVLSSNARSTEVELTVSGLYVEDAVEAGQVYQRLELGIRAGGSTREEGAPAVPVVGRFLRVPDDRAVKVEVVERDEVVLTGYRVHPAQPPQPEDRTSLPFVLDAKRYGADELYPAAAERVSEPMIMRDVRLVQLVLQPVRHNPVTGELAVAKRLVVRLSYDEPGTVNVKYRTRRGVSRAFEPLYREFVANYDFGPPQRPEDGSYLIIVNDDFASAVEPFAEWKQRKGWRTVVKTTTEIGGADSAHILACVTDAYDNWPYPPDYVLLVGDAPSYVATGHLRPNSHASDLPYVLQDGSDILADLMVARVCCRTLAEAQTAMNKLYRYEMQPYMANTGWFGKATGLAGYEGGTRFWTVVVRIRDYFMGRPLVQFDTLFERWGLNTKQGLMDSIDQGRSWLLYRGHGMVQGWDNVNPDFMTSDVPNLDNGEMLPAVVGPTCSSGDFDESEDCLAETFVKAGSPTAPKGGISYFGSSEVSYSGYNDSLAAGTFMSYVDSLDYTYAQCTQWGKLFMLEAYPLPDDISEEEVYMFNTFGEPELNVWSAVPAALSVTHPATVIIGSFPFAVTVNSSDAPVEGALVCVMSRADSTIYHVGHTDAGGQVQFTVNATLPGDSLFVTVTGRNLHPYLGSAITISPNAAYVTYLSHEVDDAAGGNGDGIINPEETINLPVWVKNWGSQPAVSVSGTLRSSDPNVTVQDSVKSYGTVGAGDSAYTGADGYEFAVAAACTNGYVLRFELECRDANDSVWTAGVNLWVGTPVMQFVDFEVDDEPPGGNGDGKVDPGETAELRVRLRNRGMGHGYDVTGLLRPGDARFQAPESTDDYPDIPADSSAFNGDAFVVHADDSIPMETVVPCTLVVSADGYEGAVAFTIAVGEIRQVDPIPDGPRLPTLYWAYDEGDTMYVEHPEFEWVEVSGTGTMLSLSDDDIETVNLPAGFGPFVYYGQSYSQVSICSNGFVAPGYQTYTYWGNQPLPYSSAPPMLAANWDDLYPPIGGGVWYYHDAANNRFVVEWDSVDYVSGIACDKFEIVLYDTTLAAPDGNSVFCFQYLTANQYSSNTVGLQDQTKTIAIQGLYDGGYHRGMMPLVAGRVIKFTTTEPATGVADEGTGTTGIGRARFAVLPNPVRATALVRFGLRRDAPVRLAVFDLAGRQVRSLVNAPMKPGDYSVRWDGRDDAGRRLSQGVYFLRLDADGERLVKKTVLLD